MVLAEAASVVTTLRSAAEIAEKLRKLVGNPEAEAQAGALIQMVGDARLQTLKLIEEKALLLDDRVQFNQRIDALEGEVRRLSDFDEKSGKYERIQTPARKFVYREIGGDQSAYFCAHCFSEKKLSVLQPREDGNYHFCHACKWGDYLQGSPRMRHD